MRKRSQPEEYVKTDI